MTDRTIAAVHPATPVQQGFLLGTLAAPEDALFVEQAVLPLAGPLEVSRLERALAGMIASHEILRTGLAWNLAADPQQVVLTRSESAIGVVDSRRHDTDRQQADLEELLRAQRAEPFDLTRPPLLRLVVQHLDGERHHLVWTHHHGVLDGWSHLALVDELLQRYAGGVPAERAGFGVYARWLAAQDRGRQRAYWAGHLAGYQPLPAVAEHSLLPDQERHGQHHLAVDAATAEALDGFARAHGTTAAAVLISCWGLVAARQRGRDDIAVGVTLSGRTAAFPGVADLIGPVATTMPIRLPAPVGDAGRWVSAIQDLLAEAEANSACSTADLYAGADLAPGGALYDSVVSIANYPHTGDRGSRPGLVLETAGIRSEGGRTRHPLALVVETFDGLRLRLVNDRTRTGDDDARAALHTLHTMLHRLAGEATVQVTDLAAATSDLTPFQPRQPQTGDLPAPGRTADGSDPLVRVLTDAFADVLGQPVGADDDFLAAGGHSLLALRLATRLRTALGVDLTLGDLLTGGTPRALATRVRHLLTAETTAPDPLPPLTPAPPAGAGQPFALTGIQQAYWTGRNADFDLGGVDSHLYTEADLPDVDLERLTAVWRALIDRHPMLRAVTTPDGRQQILTDVPPYRIHTTDLRTDAEAEAQLAQVRERLAHARRDTGTWPLFTIEAALLPDGTTRLFLSFDLLIGDALSWQILYREARALYEDPGAELPVLELTFADYVAHLPALATGPRFERDRAYWRAKLPALPAPPALPLLPEPAAPAGGPRFSRLQLRLPADDLTALRRVAAAHGATLSALLMAVFAETLGRFTNSSTFLLNTTIYNRPDVHPQINQIVGDFTSTVLTGIDLGAPTFAQRLRALQRQLWADLDHARYSGVDVLRDLREARDRTAAAAPVVFTSTLDLEVPGSEPATPFPGTIGFGIGQTPQVLVDYQTYQADGHLVINFDTVDGRLPDGQVQAMLDDHAAQLRTLIDDPGAAERPRLGAPAPAPELAEPLGGNRLLHEPFIEQARRHPRRTAIVCDGERTTYGELADAARQIAGQVTAAEPDGELVAVLCRPGREQVAATLGVLLAGYAYVPLDPAWPAERLHDLLAATGAAVVVTEQETRASTRLPGGLTVLLTDDATPAGDMAVGRAQRGRTAEDLAYVIYTSGSTGRPKGVMISHQGALNTVLDVNERFGIGTTDAVLAVSPATFDLAVWDLLGTLAAGATLVVPTRDQRLDPAAWTALARAEHVTVWNSVPVLMDLLLDTLPPGDTVLEGLRVCLLSGDWIPLQLPGRLRERAPKCRIVSLGGATEGSIWSILHEIGNLDPAWSSIPYGTAMTGQSVQVLDDQLLPCPAHVPGQLYIGGHGTALGYWQAPELTEAAFVFDGRTGRRLYRTGDWGRLRPDGTLEFLGRRDAQVKIRGYRVELREVETALRAVPGVEQAAVVATGERTNLRLAAFAVTTRPPDAVRADLARRLPAHMLPAALTILPALPLSATSKVDRSALERLAADPGHRAPQPATGHARHDTGLEKELRAALAAIMPGRPGLDEDLLAFGITSVDVIRLANTVEQHTGRRPDLKAFYAAPTLRTLLQHNYAPADDLVPAAPGVWSGWPQLTDPAERAAFRAARPAHGPAPASRTLPERAPGHLDIRARRRTPRTFDPRPVTLEALADLLDSLRRTDAGGRPAFLYPSAGGLYAVQVHLHVRPGRIQGLPGGLYGYHPDAHDLTPHAPDIDLDPGIHLGPANRPLANTAAFSFFLTTDPAESAPLYGCDAEPLALLNAGYIGQLLCHTAIGAGLALAPVHGLDFDRIRWLLPGGERLVLLHTLLGGIPDHPAAEGEPA
ncbi:non-ribosomal peptide synthetase [Streptomyces sp. NBC_01264]|uniref:non-ribosomal peptide synthetase n=1 Tax=Streptomyces sp. NBC_01264 TaxID=2903804 RepID=UPI00225C10AC|nr:non-ribosomal peptide synthetase [Streptomyces sp. NBC_01264]MCX4784013.1 amino acid adenylation domain-containing protein [Streptomyces sp. NBC_01264]